MRSGTPPTLAETTGMPSSIASQTEFGEFSMIEGHTNTLLFRYCSFICCAVSLPSIVTLSWRWPLRISPRRYFP